VNLTFHGRSAGKVSTKRFYESKCFTTLGVKKMSGGGTSYGLQSHSDAALTYSHVVYFIHDYPYEIYYAASG
jgi:hypothetical protein